MLGQGLRRLERLCLVLGDVLLASYQWCVSPWLGARCRFYPSCSQYARETLAKDGLVRGLWKACARVMRCHPGTPGGADFP